MLKKIFPVLDLSGFMIHKKHQWDFDQILLENGTKISHPDPGLMAWASHIYMTCLYRHMHLWFCRAFRCLFSALFFSPPFSILPPPFYVVLSFALFCSQMMIDTNFAFDVLADVDALYAPATLHSQNNDIFTIYHLWEISIDAVTEYTSARLCVYYPKHIEHIQVI